MMLEAVDISVTIQESEILKGVSFQIRDGVTGIIGPNGSGKTTLFNALSGFHYLRRGKISFRGRDITTLPAHERARLGIGRVFQNAGVFREMSVLENMLTALEGSETLLQSLNPWGAERRAQRQRALELLGYAGLEDKSGARAGSLSGGQLRLLEIVRCLASGAELFLLDEPTAGVSPKMKDEVSSMITKLKTLGKTVLIIEHDIDFIYEFSDRIIVLNDGRVVLEDNPLGVLKSEVLREIYFGKRALHP